MAGTRASRLAAEMNDTPNSAPLIGIFDSGVGGLSVLHALRQAHPTLPILYVADSAYAPYGDRDPEHVRTRSLIVARHLVDQGARMLVVACNTATAMAIDSLREQFPQLPMVGVEPGVKPAALQSRNKRIAVMATPGTLASARYASLVERHASDCLVLAQPCPGLAAAIERGDEGRAETLRLLDRFCAPIAAAGVDTVVLGCTHYPFVRDQIAGRLPAGVALLETGPAVARQVMKLGAGASGTGMPVDEADLPAGQVVLQSTGDPTVLERLAHDGLGLALQAQRVQLDGAMVPGTGFEPVCPIKGGGF